ncbi:MAG: UDP-N-acetylglucosamine--N-acetylmuramyl-(pentapeptide) pyrophosphoryl-undecaprenol N-acetylglucosamine transferase [Candidatus Nealsonbacteria bacterium]|nr:UDP-N-acetylglucosamine--N-acetylmuramyl-(pentapeptide) pyrophosphoryl-undecaprenol N-acetylglucosamine transferase [Candidatus Nealsonbacteria bacterium]
MFTGGGTAGHVFPIIAVVRELNRMGVKAEYIYIGPKDDFGSMLLSQEGVKVKIISSGKIRRYLNWRSALYNSFDILFKIPFGFAQSFFYILLHSPNVIFSKGGYGSLAPIFCGWILRRPIILHESDVAPGLANKILSRFTKQILVSFPVPYTEYFSAAKMISVGNPIRRELLEGSKEGAARIFELSGEKPLILIIGGSQGAQFINNLILNILPQMIENFEIIHQTGEKKYAEIKAEARVIIAKEMDRYYHPVSFLREIELREAYTAADLIISRGGSGSIFEIAAVGKASILIPLANSAQDHQVKNSYTYADRGAAIVMEEANIAPHFLLEKMKNLFARPEDLERMSQNAHKFAKPDSAKLVAEYILNYLK